MPSCAGWRNQAISGVTLRRYYFLDESGDPGFDVANGASSHFVLALVRLPERSPLPEMKALRQKLHLRETFEFKFHRLTSLQKRSFFAAMSQVEFIARVAVFDKTYIGQRWRRMSSQHFMVEAICGLAMRTPAKEVVDLWQPTL